MNQDNFEFYYFQYIVLFIFLLFSFWNNRNKLVCAQNNRQFWKAAILPIVGYGIWMGLRFGRGIDWNYYYNRYYDIYNNFAKSDYEFIFKCICYSFASIKIPYYIFICIMDMTLMAALLFFLRKYGKAIPFILILFLFFCFQAENYIRWYIGIIFILIYMKYIPYIGDGYKPLLYIIISSILAIGVHIGFVPVVFILLFFSRIKRLLIHPYICFVLFIISIFFMQNSFFTPLTKYLQIFAFNERSEHYTMNAVELLTGDFGQVGLMQITKLTDKIKYIFLFAYPIFMIPKLLERKHILTMDANLFMVMVILFPLLRSVEILDRYSAVLALYSIIVMGCTYYYSIKTFRTMTTTMKLLFISSAFSFIWLFYFNILNKSKWFHLLYIWNNDSLETLPVNLFIK